jgi:hypothetical protein
MSLENENLNNDVEIVDDAIQNATDDTNLEEDTELEKSDDSANEDIGDDTDEPKSDLNKKFAGVRKSAEEKGFRKGYAEALAAQQQQNSQFYTPQPQAQYHAEQQQPAQAQNAAPNMAFSEKAAALQYRDGLGKAMYNDWNTVTAKLTAQAQYEATYGDKSLANIIAKAAMLPNGEKIIYHLGKDSAAMAKLRAMSPVMQADEMASLIQPKTKTKIANKPVQEIKAPPTNGGSKETDAERNARVRAKLMSR